MRIDFKVACHDETGLVGLVPEGLTVSERYYPIGSGEGLAHDVVEHLNGFGAIGSLADEAQAIGAAWYSRGRYADYNRNTPMYVSPESGLANDVTSLAEDFECGAELDEAPRTAAVTAPLEVFQDAINEGVRVVEGAFDRRYAKHHLLRWMIIGWNKARQRYEQYGEYTANSLFWNIADAAKEQMPWLMDEDGDAHRTFRLHYCIKTCEARFTETTPKHWYEE